ncbi:MAG TPA: F0F1 ATP synthase subunit epsilon [Candidatus Sulfotelmatobacter sp.]|nr:F0F1 ATP synthase subunit epsilon [Candidatus Sulfotelmatobacter sp.]
MANTLKLEIVTPEARTFSEDVDMVELTGVDGEMGILPQHTPLMTELVEGEIRAIKDGKPIFLAVGKGFVQVTGDRVSILTDMAIRAENIDEAAAEQARQRAEERLKHKLGTEDAAMVEASLTHALTQLRVKRKSRH